MSVRMRHTRSQTNSRRSHHALDGVKSVTDKETGKRRLPHTLDETTGMYRGKQIAAPKVAKVKAGHNHGADTTPAGEHEHAHADHANAEVLASKGVAGKVATGGRPKARSGFGGGA